MSEHTFEHNARFVLQQINNGWELFSTSFRTTWIKRELKWLGVTCSDDFIDLLKRAIDDPKSRTVGKTNLVRVVAVMAKARRRQLRTYAKRRRKQLQARGSKTFDAPCGRRIVESFVPLWIFESDYGMYAIYRPKECVNRCQTTGRYDVCLTVAAGQNWQGWDFADTEQEKAS